jgi:glycosyltransferase involved in cell wall biosynthesis
MEKIGIGIITYESENYLQELYKSIPLEKIDEIVIVNGGDPYIEDYEVNWIQHKNNYYPAMCRNDAVNFLLQRDCKHIFLIEDDMIIKDANIFNKYIEASKKSGIKYFGFVSTSWNSGEPGKRTPKLQVEYENNVGVSFYSESCNEFTYHRQECFNKVGLYDTSFRDPFDIDMLYREAQEFHYPGFRWFPDITNSDDYIMNNPEAVSRLQAENRADGSREQRIAEQWKLFQKKHGVLPRDISGNTKEFVVNWLKEHKNR